MIFSRNACILCAMCGKVTALFSFAPKYTVQNPFWKRKVCPEFINVIIENNLSHKSDAKSTLYNVAMKSGHTCIFHKVFCTVYFVAEENNAVTLPHSAQRKHAFLGKTMEKSKKKKLPARNETAL